MDDEPPAETAGTTREPATARAPLEDAVARRRKRASFLGWLAEGGLPGLTGPVERPGETRR